MSVPRQWKNHWKSHGLNVKLKQTQTSLVCISKSGLHENIQARLYSVITLMLSVSHLERGQHLIRFLIGTGGNRVAGVAVRVNDRVSSLPANDDGPFSPRRTVELLHVTLLRHGGVGVTGDHSWDWVVMVAGGGCIMMERR